MTKEEYIQERRIIESEEGLLRDKKFNLDSDYISEHRRYNDGDKVVITIKSRKWLDKIIPEQKIYAYIEKVTVYNGILNYHFWKAKKDGSKSQHTLHMYYYDKIELLEPAKP